MADMEQVMRIVSSTLADEFSDLTDIEQGTRVTLRLLLALAMTILTLAVTATGLAGGPAITLPALGAVADDLEISGNPALAQCLVDDLLDQLNLQGGIGGEVLVVDTDEGCSCETNGGGLEATCL